MTIQSIGAEWEIHFTMRLRIVHTNCSKHAGGNTGTTGRTGSKQSVASE